MADRLKVECPCCGNQLVVDSDSGDVLAEERPRPDHDKTFETAVTQIRSGGKRRDEAFAKAFDRTRRLEDVLEKKFEEARKKASKDDRPPRNPLDLD